MMENWQAELDRAREEGRKLGVTEGYSKGYKDGLRIGYAVHELDMLDCLESFGNMPFTGSSLLDKLEPITQVRRQTGIFMYDTKDRNKD